MQQGQPYGSGVGTERITAFSDGVFAIAITLLVLDLRPPEVGSHASAEQAAALMALLPKVQTFILSFLIIALYWQLHHRMFSYIERYDPALLWLNVLYLLGITFLPFPTAVLGEYGPEWFVVVLYLGNLALVGLFGTAMWWYATRGRRLVGKDVPARLITYGTLRGVVNLIVFTLGTALAFVNPNLALYCPLVLPIAYWALHRLYYREEAEIVAREFGAREEP
jgi:uncharacterized membrane protein